MADPVKIDLPPSTPLSDVRAAIEAEKKRAGCVCPACGRTTKVYRRAFNAGMATCLAWLYSWRHHALSVEGRSGGMWNGPHEPFAHVPTEAPDEVVRSREFDKLALHGVAERAPKVDEGGSRTSGRWRITYKGVRFVQGWVRLPSHLLVSHGATVEGRSVEDVTFADVLGDRFSYEAVALAEPFGPTEAAPDAPPSLFDYAGA